MLKKLLVFDAFKSSNIISVFVQIPVLFTKMSTDRKRYYKLIHKKYEAINKAWWGMCLQRYKFCWHITRVLEPHKNGRNAIWEFSHAVLSQQDPQPLVPEYSGGYLVLSLNKVWLRTVLPKQAKGPLNPPPNSDHWKETQECTQTNFSRVLSQSLVSPHSRYLQPKKHKLQYFSL